MATIESDFEAKLEAAVMDDVEATLVGEEANLVFEFVGLVHTNLQAYGQRNGYDVASTIDSLGTPQVDRANGTISVTVGWESGQMARWEFGVSSHTIDGDPLLSFVWEDPPKWVKQEFDQARSTGGEFASGWQVYLPEVDHPGIPESRAIRDALNGLRRVLRS
jgi:hypothetical protein